MALEIKTGYLRYQKHLAQIKEIYKKREDVRVYAGLILSLLTISFFGFFAIKPTLTTIASLVKEIKDKREVNQKLQKKINSLTQAQSELLLISDDLYLLDEALSPKPNLAPFINQLEVMIRKNNLKTNLLSFSPVIFFEKEKAKETPQTNQDYKENNFSLQVSGPLTDLRKFLETLENFRRIIQIKTFSLSLEKDQVWNLALKGNIFYQKR